MSQLSPFRNARLTLEALEARETPAVNITESFDSLAAGAIPEGWSEWTNDGSGGFGASSGQSLSPSLSLFDNGGSAHSARAWLDQVLPADQRVAASVFLDSLL